MYCPIMRQLLHEHISYRITMLEETGRIVREREGREMIAEKEES